MCTKVLCNSLDHLKCHVKCLINRHTDAKISLHTLLVKYYNDLLGRLCSERDRDEVTYFSVGDLFYIHLGTKYANFQEKIFAENSGKKFQTFHCSNVTNRDVCNFIPVPLRTLSSKQVIVVLY